MNMMTMAKMEEAIKESWTIYWADDMPHRLEAAVKWPDMVLPVSRNFERGFRAGVTWAQSQEGKQGSSQAVGNISPQLVRTLVSQFVVWTQMRDIWLHRRKFGESPRALHYGELPHLWKEFAAEFCSGKVVLQYPAAVEEPEEEV